MGRLIDADRLKRKCQKVATEAWKMKIKASVETTLNQFIDWIDQADPVDAVPVRYGQWNCSDDVYETAVCSVCGWDTTDPWVHIKEWFEFCPHCGARMDGKDGGNGSTD